MDSDKWIVFVSTPPFMSQKLPAANWKGWIMHRIGRMQAFLVEGDSMTPTLSSGNVVLVRTAATYNVGDIVLAKHPYKASVKMLKRIDRIEPDGTLHLIGDNPGESTDSRTFGAVSIESILGRAVSRLK